MLLYKLSTPLEKLRKYIEKLFKKYGKAPTLLLDAACGTGGFSNEFAKLGIEVIGADMSEEMLSIARESAMEQGNDILFLCQRLEELDLYGTADAFLCMIDGINYCINQNAIYDMIKRIKTLSMKKLYISVNMRRRLLKMQRFYIARENREQKTGLCKIAWIL
mgnify:CR=1 FL=1